MKLEDVQALPKKEKRSCRADIRLYPSQLKFINDKGLSITRIVDVALNELGHKPPTTPEEINRLSQIMVQQKKKSKPKRKTRRKR